MFEGSGVIVPTVVVVVALLIVKVPLALPLVIRIVYRRRYRIAARVGVWSARKGDRQPRRTGLWQWASAGLPV